MDDIAARIDRELVRALVARRITCPRTGEVLDMRTCVVLRDRDGDPIAVLSQEGWRQQSEEAIAVLAARGISVDESTVRNSS